MGLQRHGAEQTPKVTLQWVWLSAPRQFMNTAHSKASYPEHRRLNRWRHRSDLREAKPARICRPEHLEGTLEEQKEQSGIGRWAHWILAGLRDHMLPDQAKGNLSSEKTENNK